MIPDKINDIFIFIDFLHSNISEFKKYIPNIVERKRLNIEYRETKELDIAERNTQRDKIQPLLNEQEEIIKLNFQKPINDKSKNLNIWSKKENLSGHCDFNVSKTEIDNFKQNADAEDAKITIEHKAKYVEFRRELDNYLQPLLCIFWAEVDEFLFELFYDFDKKNTEDNFKPFFSKKIVVNPKGETANSNPNNNKSSNPHPDFFVDEAYDIFELWMTKSKDPLDKKLSFIIQKLNDEEKLRANDFERLSKWALENDFLDEYHFKKLYEQKHFHQPSKIFTQKRLELYDALTN